MPLKGISALISPELLHALASMGHGDEIVIADGALALPACMLTSVGRVVLESERVDRDPVGYTVFGVVSGRIY
jgi:L-fucose mutarotase/ribose pyranase (RbsD/FucU family)